MQTIVIAKLGMECDGDDIALTRGHGMAIDLPQDLNAGPVLGYPGSTDKDPAYGRPVDPGKGHVGLKAPDLASEGVALSAHVHQVEVL